jgi:hypothetical protein
LEDRPDPEPDLELVKIFAEGIKKRKKRRRKTILATIRTLVN